MKTKQGIPHTCQQPDNRLAALQKATIGVSATIILLVCCLTFVSPLSASAPTYSKLIKGNGPLVITHSATMPPISFLDNKGQPSGFVIELWKEWSKVTGIPVTFTLTTWENSLRLVAEGKAHIHGGLFLTPERSKTLLFGEPYFSIKGAIFVRKDVRAETPSDLGHVPVGVLKSGYSEHYMKTRYPEVQLTPYTTVTELAHEAATGNLVAFQADFPTMSHLLKAKHVDDRFRILKVLYDRHLYYAVPPDNHALLEIVSDGMAKIDRSTRSRIFNRWVIDNQMFPQIDKTSGGILALTLFAGALLFLVLTQRQQIRDLKNIVHKADNERNAAVAIYESATGELQHLRSVVDRLPDMDPLTGLPNRNHLTERLARTWHESMLHGRPVALVVVDATTAFSSLGESEGRDMTIKSFAETLTSCPLRREDMLVRLDETVFACLLPDTDKRGAQLVRDSIRMAALDFGKKLNTTAREEELPLTGYACADPYTGDSPASLLEEAMLSARQT